MAKKVALQLFENSKTRKVKSKGSYGEDPFIQNAKVTEEHEIKIASLEGLRGKVVRNITPKFSKNNKFVKTILSKTGRINENKYLTK